MNREAETPMRQVKWDWRPPMTKQFVRNLRLAILGAVLGLVAGIACNILA